MLGQATTGNQELSLLNAPVSCLTDHLQACVAENDRSTITIEGYVTERRQIGRALVFVDFLSDQSGLCQALLRLDHYEGENYDGYRLSLITGSRFRITGRASSTRNPGEAVLIIQTLQLIGLPRQSQHIQKILTLAKEGRIPVKEVILAADQAILTEDLLSNTVDLKELSKRILQAMADDPHYPQASDQKKRSQKGNYTLLQAPSEWEHIPPLFEITATSPNLQSVAQILEENRICRHVTISGWIQNRRRFQDRITVLQVVDDLSSVSNDILDDGVDTTDKNRVACLLHPSLLPSDASLYRTVLAVGSRVRMQGFLVPAAAAATESNNGGTFNTTTLWVTHIRLLRATWRPGTLRHILDLVQEKKFDLEEASEALSLSYQEVQLLSETSDATQRQWKAMELSSILQTSQSRHASLSTEFLQVLDKYQILRERFPVMETIVDHNEQDNLFRASSPDTKWQAKKQPQLMWMAHHIRSVITSHPDYGKRTLHILDIGGGKGLLANYLGRLLQNVQIHVIDIAEGAIANGAMRAKRLKVSVDFQVADASIALDVAADVVIALHACGHLSDVALAHAVQRGAGFVICPCCFRSNPHLRIPITREVVEDWLGVPPEDWNALKLIAEVQGDTILQSKATATICALRAHAASQKSLVNVSIKSFPIQYSTRNVCLIGTVSCKI